MFCIIHQLLYILKFVLLHYMYIFLNMLYVISHIFTFFIILCTYCIIYCIFICYIWFSVLKTTTVCFCKVWRFFSFAYFWIGFDQSWKNHWILLQQSGRLVVPKFQMHKQCVLHSTHMIPHSIPLFGTSIFTTTSKVSNHHFCSTKLALIELSNLKNEKHII